MNKHKFIKVVAFNLNNVIYRGVRSKLKLGGGALAFRGEKIVK